MSVIGPILAFLIALGIMVVVRVRSGGKFEVKPGDLLAPVILVALIMFLTGQIEQLTFGELRITNAIKDAYASDVGREVERAAHISKMPIAKLVMGYEFPVDASAGENLEGCDTLTFDAKKAYFPKTIRTFLDKYSTIQYMVINEPEGELWGFADFGGVRRKLGEENYLANLVQALKDFEKGHLRKLPGFVSVEDAIRLEDDRRKALQRMSQLKVDKLPVLDKGSLYGTVDRNELAISLLIDFAKLEP